MTKYTALYHFTGNLVNWWDADTKRKFSKKAQCIIDQYGNYTVSIDGEILYINGVNTQGENIADNGGIKVALNAYKKLVYREGPEPMLPALKYNQRQLFWLSSASPWCSVHRPDSLRFQESITMNKTISLLLSFYRY